MQKVEDPLFPTFHGKSVRLGETEMMAEKNHRAVGGGFQFPCCLNEEPTFSESTFCFP